MTLPAPLRGVEILGCSSVVPDKLLTNADLETLMDTSHEWIVQRTGISERRVFDHDKGESTEKFAAEALKRALDNANTKPDELELIIVATMTGDMPTPSVSCIIADKLGCGNIGTIDLNAACSGFVFALITAQEFVRSGRFKRVAIVGADTITRFVDYSTYGRGAAILFGDGAGAFILGATDDTSKGMIAESMHSDGGGAKHLLIPCSKHDFHNPEDYDERKLHRVQMNGQSVFKFAVSKFPKVIAETLDKAGLKASDVDHFVCHQANARILEAARDRFGLDPERLTINIDRYGNTVAASCPLVFDELTKAGRIEPGQRVMFIAFGAGLTWGASLWQL